MTPAQIDKLVRENGGTSLSVGLAALGIEPVRKPSKFNAQPTVFNGVRYDSKSEARYAAVLDLAEQAGQLLVVSRQVPFWLGTELPTKYVADWVLFEAGSLYAADLKGVWTPQFRRVVKAWRRFGKMSLRILDLKGNVTDIIPGGQ